MDIKSQNKYTTEQVKEPLKFNTDYKFSFAAQPTCCTSCLAKSNSTAS